MTQFVKHKREQQDCGLPVQSLNARHIATTPFGVRAAPLPLFRLLTPLCILRSSIGKESPRTTQD